MTEDTILALCLIGWVPILCLGVCITSIIKAAKQPKTDPLIWKKRCSRCENKDCNICMYLD